MAIAMLATNCHVDVLSARDTNEARDRHQQLGLNEGMMFGNFSVGNQCPWGV